MNRGQMIGAGSYMGAATALLEAQGSLGKAFHIVIADDMGPWPMEPLAVYGDEPSKRTRLRARQAACDAVPAPFPDEPSCQVRRALARAAM